MAVVVRATAAPARRNADLGWDAPVVELDLERAGPVRGRAIPYQLSRRATDDGEAALEHTAVIDVFKACSRSRQLVPCATQPLLASPL